MRLICLCPSLHAAVFKAVPPTYYCLKIRNFLSPFSNFCFAFCKGSESVGDQDPGIWTEPVVVQDEVFEGHVLREKVDEWSDSFQTEGVVSQVNGVEVR